MPAIDRSISDCRYKGPLADVTAHEVPEMMNFVLDMMDFALTMTDSVGKMMIFALKMMNFALKKHCRLCPTVNIAS